MTLFLDAFLNRQPETQVALDALYDAESYIFSSIGAIRYFNRKTCLCIEPKYDDEEGVLRDEAECEAEADIECETATLPAVTIDSNTCAICYEVIVNSLRILGCSHRFHEHCINGYNPGQRCPKCKTIPPQKQCCHCLYPSSYRLSDEQQRQLITYLKMRGVPYNDCDICFDNSCRLGEMDSFIVKLYNISQDKVDELRKGWMDRRLQAYNIIRIMSGMGGI